MKCPKCGRENPEGTWHCDCGYEFKDSDIKSSVSIDDNLTKFWRATWAVWRRGLLFRVNPNYKKLATLNFEIFIKKVVNVSFSPLTEFFSIHSPQFGEFLCGFAKTKDKKQLSAVITDQRMWLYAVETSQYVEYKLSDVDQYKHTRDGEFFNVTIRFKDGTEHTYSKLLSTLSDEVVHFALEVANPKAPTNTIPPSDELLHDPRARICPSCREVLKPQSIGSAIILSALLITIIPFVLYLFARLVKADPNGFWFFNAISILLSFYVMKNAINPTCSKCGKIKLILLSTSEGQKLLNAQKP